MDPRPTLEKSFTSEDDVALAKRRRQRAVKKERKRRQRSELAARETQCALVGGETEAAEERKLEKGVEDTLVTGKGALSSSFDSVETNRIDWADEVDASIPCLQPVFTTELSPRDLSCLRTDARSPWSSLCRRHQRIQRRQHHDQPSYSLAQHPRRFTSRCSRADVSTWWRRAPSTPSRSLPSRQRPDFRWQSPSSQYRDHRFKPRRAQMPLFTQSRPQYKTDRSTQTEPPPSCTANCSVQTESPTTSLTHRRTQEVATQSEQCTIDASTQTNPPPAPPMNPVAIQTEQIHSSSVSMQTDPTPPTDPQAYQRLFQIANYTRKDEDAIFEAAQMFIASPLSSMVSDALMGLHNLLFTQSFPSPAPTMLPYDPTMRFIGMYVKGWYASWLKYQI
ncbi:hypothetical protein SCHPADRAFT_905114 [Schizopora paradoxa]|uniref:Uncharacterized protein n=1 Tax=Schizopora paradoxa TaxID=27342 RepID=A0A0H2RKA8_9AGAM|nr:hypothetical protein SCHPADRAFT_905114 [Schizopora paradoxa]